MSSRGRRGGRKKDPIWDKYIEIQPDGSRGSSKAVRAKCKLCGEVMAGLVSRMKTHFQNKCKSVSDAEDVFGGADGDGLEILQVISKSWYTNSDQSSVWLWLKFAVRQTKVRLGRWWVVN